MKNLLTKEELQNLKSMGLYWEEVSKRENKFPLLSEIASVVELLGTKILFILLEYIKELEKQSAAISQKGK